MLTAAAAYQPFRALAKSPRRGRKRRSAHDPRLALERFALFMLHLAAFAPGQPMQNLGSTWVGASLVALGMLANLLATIRYARVRHAIQRGDVGALVRRHQSFRNWGRFDSTAPELAAMATKAFFSGRYVGDKLIAPKCSSSAARSASVPCVRIS